MAPMTRRTWLLGFGSTTVGVLALACQAPPAAQPTAVSTRAPAATSAPAAAGSSPTAPPAVPAASAAPKPPVASPSVVASKPSSLQNVRIGLSNASAADAGIYISDALGYFAEQGVQLQYLDFGASSEIVPALARNDLDVGETGMNPALFNALGRGIGIKLVCDNGSLPPGFGWLALVVAKGKADQIKGPADLKGRKVALTPPGLATAAGYAFVKYLTQANLAPTDVDITPLAFPEQMAALAGGAVDAAIMVEPFTTNTVNQGIGVKLAGADQFSPDQQVTTIVFTDDFIARQRDTATRWVTAYLRGIRAYNAAFRNNVDKDRIVSILVDKTAIKDKQLWSQIVPVGLRPDGSMNAASIQDSANFFQRIGQTQTAVDMTKFIDTSFLQAANAALGPVPAASPVAR